MTTGWTIEHACPQCGAQVEFDEADRILACKFCRVRNYLMPRERFRYVLPVAAGAAAEGLFYAPYWRFRGIACTCRAYDVDYRVVDTSMCAAGIAGLPQTLGFRPQAMKLRFALPENTGPCLPLAMKSTDFAGCFAEHYMQSTEKVFFRECLGETISLIYAPFFMKDRVLFDGVLNRPASPAAQGIEMPRVPDSSHADWGVSFLPTLCPNCGWDMVADKESCVLLCPKCSRAWQPSGVGYKAVSYAVMKSGDAGAQHLPFWRMQATVAGIAMQTMADLIKLANLPRLATGDDAQQPLSFWAPAFKVQPELFLRLARHMMAQQPSGETHDRLADLDLYPVTLPVREAAESIKVCLALLAARRKDIYPALANLKITVHSHELLYIPFAVTPQELIHDGLRLAIGRSALNFGRSM